MDPPNTDHRTELGPHPGSGHRGEAGLLTEDRPPLITDNLGSHTSKSTREWLARHPRIEQVFIPKGACWLNLQEACWRMLRRQGWPGSASSIRRVWQRAWPRFGARAVPC
ncbi:MAG: transposase [Dactylosporangium sp.]|nr:transposase [Dactylosporangium sp.]